MSEAKTTTAESVSKGRKLAFAILALLFAATAMIGGKPAFERLSENYRIGVDKQKVSCLPWRVYLVGLTDDTPYSRGDLVQFVAKDLEPYFKDGELVHKFIAGIPGDRIVIEDDELFVNGQYWDQLWLLDRLESRPRQFDRAFTVPEGHYFMASTTANAYDGRYWGVIEQSQVMAHVSPIW
jgi:conjugal transfer pilin signal peptidase TrbI